MSDSSGPDGPQRPSAQDSDPDGQDPSDGSDNALANSRGGMIVARYGQMKYLGQFKHNLPKAPSPGKKMVVRTDRGVELADVVANLGDDDSPFTILPERLVAWLKDNGDNYPFRKNGRVLRAASPQDLIDFRHLETSAHSERAFCRKLIRELDMDMKLVAVEHLLGGERIVFYFTAEHRVDFRELVKQLAGEYRTRIEMRQVGARDEARLVADLERCGQVCCCQQYLKELKPISMRMAKVQKATFDPSKISGRCGRLMCCLRYEDETYSELRRKLPKRKTWIRTDSLVGKVINTQIITQLVRIQLPDGTYTAVANEDILERNIPEPEPGQAPAPPKPKPQPEPEPQADQAPAEAGSDTPDSDEKSEGSNKSKSRRRRRRRKGKSSSDSGGSDSKGQAPAKDGSKSSSASASKKRRRRRRRKPKSGDSGSSGSSSGSSGGG